MCARRVVVLKFGGSVLREVEDTARVAQEIVRWRRQSWEVVAVVSAIGNTTDRLVQRAHAFDAELDPRKYAALLSTGERQSAALTGLALDRAGIESIVADEVQIGLVTEGDPADARPVSLTSQVLRDLLGKHGVVVVPGFIGRDRDGNVTLLGRGGSDLTALFVAREIGATKCRLVKDVAGLYEFDPKSANGALPGLFDRVRYADALALDESIVQHKGIRFAQKTGLEFEVGALFRDDVTRVGAFAASHLSAPRQDAPKIRVALLGTGAVGLGVWHWLRTSGRDRFDVVATSSRNRDKALAAGIPATVYRDDPASAIQEHVDVVIELIGGCEPARTLVEDALKRGCDVITANKTLLAGSGESLGELARLGGASLAGSASVGGAIPVLETIADTKREGRQLARLRAILNGTSNHVLEQVQQGVALAEAVEAAQLAGLAESDPRRDLGGLDAAEKLVLIARAAGHRLTLEEIRRTGIDEEQLHRLAEETNGTGSRLKQVVEWEPASAQAPCISLRWLNADDPLATVRGAGNCIELLFEDGGAIVLRGTGAGRWATTTSVIADLLDIAARRRDCLSQAMVAIPELEAPELAGTG